MLFFYRVEPASGWRGIGGWKAPTRAGGPTDTYHLSFLP